MKENYQIIETDKELNIIIKKKPNWLVLIMTGLWLIHWVVIITIIFYGIITDPEKFDEELFFAIFIMIVVGLLILKIFLWNLKGKEIVTINNNELIIKKAGTILSFPSKYRIDYLENISITENATTPKWIKTMGLGGGQIEFIYLDNIKYFGQSLNDMDSSKIIQKMKQFVFNKK